MPPKKENSRRGRSFGSALINFYSQILFQADETKFRDLRKTPLSALTARSNRSFPLCAAFRGTPFMNAAQIHLSCTSAVAQIECAGAKARFCLREYLVHENSFELTKEFSVRKGETCRALPRKIARHTGGGFSPLFLPFGGSRFINGKKIHLHPYTYKGKTAKA